MAERPDTTIPPARLTDDPVLRAFFERSAPDTGEAFAVPDDDPPELIGGAALELAEA